MNSSKRFMFAASLVAVLLAGCATGGETTRLASNEEMVVPTGSHIPAVNNAVDIRSVSKAELQSLQTSSTNYW